MSKPLRRVWVTEEDVPVSVASDGSIFIREQNSASIDDAIDSNQLAILTRSILTGERADGTFENIQIDHDNSVYVHQNLHTVVETSAHMVRNTGVYDELASIASKGDQVITVKAGGKWSAGDKLKMIDNDAPEYDFFTVIVVDGNNITLDRQLDIGHSANVLLYQVAVNMAVDGSATSQTFSYAPRPTQVVHIHEIHVVFQSTTEPALFRFGGSAALTYGAHLRVRNETGRDYTWAIPFRTMNGMRLSGFSYAKETKVGTLWAAHLTASFDNISNSVIKLDGSLGQSLEVIIRDDNTDNTSMEVKLAYHEEP